MPTCVCGISLWGGVCVEGGGGVEEGRKKWMSAPHYIIHALQKEVILSSFSMTPMNLALQKVTAGLIDTNDILRQRFSIFGANRNTIIRNRISNTQKSTQQILGTVVPAMSGHPKKHS